MRTEQSRPSAAVTALVVAVPFLVLVAAIPLLGLDRLALIGPHLLPKPNWHAGPFAEEWVFMGLTMFGAGVGQVTLVAMTIVALLLQRRRDAAAFVAVVTIGASLLGKLVKAITLAPRPPLDPTLPDVTGIPHVTIFFLAALLLVGGYVMKRRREGVIAASVLVGLYAVDFVGDHAIPLTSGFDSFPSGHAVGTMSFAVAFAIACPIRGRWRRPAIGLVVLYTLGVGVSRLYLGVHYPADVVAGWCLAIAWALACAVAWDRIADRRDAASAPKSGTA